MCSSDLNAYALKEHKGIIANPNCTTIQMVSALNRLNEYFDIERIIVSTYQAVSGAGVAGMEELYRQSQEVLDGQEPVAKTLPCASDKKHYPIAFNALPQIDVFSEAGYTYEEWKMMNETKKIMGDNKLKVVATCVRIPVISGHSESVYIEVKQADASVSAIQELMAQAPGVILQDEPSEQLYPQALNSVNQKETFVGRIRQDVDVKNGFHLWIVSDNLLKGAAWNSVQIAETLHEMNLLRVPEND